MVVKQLPLTPQRLLRRAHLLGDFLAVADAGAIRAAAAQQNLSQSAITRRIQELEGELGVELFERHPHGMTLTKFGTALKHHADLVALTCNYAVGEINDLLGGGTGELRVAAGPAWGYALVPDAIAAVQTIMPRVRIHLLNRLNETTLPMLSDGRLDVVLGGLPEEAERALDITYEPVIEIEHLIFASKQHPLVVKKSITPKDAAGYPWAWFAEAVSARDLLDTWFSGAGLAPPVSAVETSSVQSGFRLLQRGHHLMVMPSTLSHIAAIYGLAPLRTRGRIGRYVSGLMYRPSVMRLRAFSVFRDHLLKLTRQLAA